MNKFFLLFIRPDRFDSLCSPLTDDEKVILNIANENDITPEQVLAFAAKHACVDFTMDEFYVTGTLPWQLRNWLRLNS